MKTVLYLCVMAAVASAAPGNTYTNRFDNINLDEIMTNKRLLSAYVNCLLERGKCTAAGKELKSHVKDALETRCAKCTDAQRSGTRRMIGHLINNEPRYWDELKAKYDPEQKYTQRYEDELRTVTA